MNREYIVSRMRRVWDETIVSVPDGTLEEDIIEAAEAQDGWVEVYTVDTEYEVDEVN